MKLLHFILFLGLLHNGLSQKRNSWVPGSVSLHSKTGFLIAHRANMSHLAQKNSYAFELELSQQDTTSNRWAEIYKKPFRGVSLQYQNFGNSKVLGNGLTIFAHTAFPLYSNDRFGTIYFRGGTGISYITKIYNTETNLKNNAIGTHLNGFVSLQFRWKKYFNHWHIGTFIDFLHYSNASMKVPNLGLNLPVLGIDVGYDLHPVDHQVDTKKISRDAAYEDRMADELRIFVIGGAKQNIPRFNPVRTHPVLAMQGLYSMKTGKRWKVDFGVDLMYNGANRHYLDTSAYTVGETFQLGVFVGASIHFYRAEFLTGIGVYAWSPLKPFGWVYNRLGFRYHFTPHISGMVGIKAHLGIADYLEFGIAYRLWRGK
ncbi:MAG: acyloxyacyl hydrolase [Crocinitomicaceae bacterium]